MTIKMMIKLRYWCFVCRSLLRFYRSFYKDNKRGMIVKLNDTLTEKKTLPLLTYYYIICPRLHKRFFVKTLNLLREFDKYAESFKTE